MASNPWGKSSRSAWDPYAPVETRTEHEVKRAPAKSRAKPKAKPPAKKSQPTQHSVTRAPARSNRPASGAVRKTGYGGWLAPAAAAKPKRGLRYDKVPDRQGVKKLPPASVASDKGRRVGVPKKTATPSYRSKGRHAGVPAKPKGRTMPKKKTVIDGSPVTPAARRVARAAAEASNRRTDARLSAASASRKRGTAASRTGQSAGTVPMRSSPKKRYTGKSHLDSFLDRVFPGARTGKVSPVSQFKKPPIMPSDPAHPVNKRKKSGAAGGSNPRKRGDLAPTPRVKRGGTSTGTAAKANNRRTDARLSAVPGSRKKGKASTSGKVALADTSVPKKRSQPTEHSVTRAPAKKKPQPTQHSVKRAPAGYLSKQATAAKPAASTYKKSSKAKVQRTLAKVASRQTGKLSSKQQLTQARRMVRNRKTARQK